MTRPPIAFEHARTDVVTAVLIPIDGVTRRPVRGGVDVQLWDPERDVARSHRLVRNLSGHSVLLNVPADQGLTFRVDPAAAGYQGPLLVTFRPGDDRVSMVVRLEPRPDYAFDDGTTLVRGSVVRSGGPVPVPVGGLTVTAVPAASSAGHQFPATTDGRGVFALAVGLKVVPSAEGQPPVPTVLRFGEPDSPIREITRGLDEGRIHVFAQPIDLDGDNQPHFTEEARP